MQSDLAVQQHHLLHPNPNQTTTEQQRQEL
jgi:hypothetical protein